MIAPNTRLIKIGDTKTYVHVDKLKELEPKAGELVNFVDMTETPFLEDGAVPESSPIPERPTQQAKIRPIITKIESGHSFDHLKSVVTHLSSYRTRHANTDTGVQAVHWLKAEYEKRIKDLPPARKNLFSIQLFNHTSWRQPSLIVRMKGTSDELVVLGGHIDSTASGGVAPGADDDATGSSLVLEVFTLIAKYSDYVPTKTIEWHAYAAEEMGLLGSRAIVAQYKRENKKVMAMLQSDMHSFSCATCEKVSLVTNGVNAQLTEFLKKLITEYGKMGFSTRSLFGGTSDHASWMAGGYKAAFPFEVQTNPHIHTARDTVDKLNFKIGVEHVKLAVAFLIECSHN